MTKIFIVGASIPLALLAADSLPKAVFAALGMLGLLLVMVFRRPGR